MSLKQEPTAPEPLTVDPKIAAAIDNYCDRTGIMRPDEFVERAILCYLLAQRTVYSFDAIQESGLLGEDNEQAEIVPEDQEDAK